MVGYEVYLMVEEKTVKDLKTVDEVIEVLSSGKPEGNSAVVRCATDRDFFRMIVRINETAQRAVSGAQLSGGVVKLWTNTASYVDGAGWRMVLATAMTQPQIPAVPGLNGGRLHSGRG